MVDRGFRPEMMAVVEVMTKPIWNSSFSVGFIIEGSEQLIFIGIRNTPYIIGQLLTVTIGVISASLLVVKSFSTEDKDQWKPFLFTLLRGDVDKEQIGGKSALTIASSSVQKKSIAWLKN